jgi:CRISPR-associated endonuclease Cas1
LSEQHPQKLNPRHGVITLYGYGISARVDRGHLILEDGIGDERRFGRFARVNHGINRLVIVGNHGSVSLSALRWLSDQNAAFTMLERDGSVLMSTGPVAATDARFRRAQALAQGSEIALPIVRELIRQKLAGQERVARTRLSNSRAADSIHSMIEQIAVCDAVESVAQLESHGASEYWSAWRDIPVSFPKSELPRVPDHWRTFGPRNSPLSSSPRKAANPANAILNYLYTILESETRLAIAALGLDPGFGVLHCDRAIRDSLACDLMEPVRPLVDAYLLDLLSRSPLKREWFFEQTDGNCRLMAPFAQKLSETALTWSREVAPIVEWFAQEIWTTVPNASGRRAPGTRLTKRKWYAANRIPEGQAKAAPETQSLCRNCGVAISVTAQYCGQCVVILARENLKKAGEQGRERALTPEAKAKRSDTARKKNAAQQAWDPASLPKWLTHDAYVNQVRPLLERCTRSAIAEVIDSGIDYAGQVRAGRRIPHSRHWEKLAELAGMAHG